MKDERDIPCNYRSPRSQRGLSLTSRRHIQQTLERIADYISQAMGQTKDRPISKKQSRDGRFQDLAAMISARDEWELMFFLWEFLDKKVWESNEEEYAKAYFHWYTDGRKDYLLFFRTLWE